MREEEFLTKDLRTIDLKKANIIAIYFVLVMLLVYGIPFMGIWYNSFSKDFLKASFEWISSYPVWLSTAIFFFVPLLGIVVHELIHGIFWSFFAKKGWKSIKFGYLKETATPYCHCKEPLLVWQYAIGAVMPFVVLGLLPAIWALASGNVLLLLFAVIFSVSAVGDFMILNLIRKEKKDAYVQDHPSEAGYYIYSDKRVR